MERRVGICMLCETGYAGRCCVLSLQSDEYDIDKVAVGQPCTVTIVPLGLEFETEVAHVDRVSASSGSVAYYTVTATVEVTEDVFPGMQVTVSIPKEEAKDVVVLKMDALSFDETNRAFVYTINENGAMDTRYVEVGVDNGNYVEIKSGLENGETVYVETEEEVTASGGLQDLLSGFMGGTQINRPDGFNQRSGGMGGNFGNMPDMNGFGGNNQRGGAR